ncbi:MAG TPA: leucyl aminopeptidase [Patescibacteria group bacterium]|nr:leucyl aminopeptidase [Patescibacteria group bacterium]
MKFEISQNLLSKISSDVVLVYVFQNENEKGPFFISSSAYSQLNKALSGQLDAACQAERFKGQQGKVVSVFTQDKIVPTKVVVMGLGKKSGFVLNDLRKVTGKIVTAFRKRSDSLVIAVPEDLDESAQEACRVIVEAVDLASYEFAKYKAKKPEDRNLETVILAVSEQVAIVDIKKVVQYTQLYTEATILARDLVNEPAYIATPTYLADLAEDIAKANPSVTCKIFGKTQIEKMGMEAFLGIARAANTEPKFIYLSYTPEKVGQKNKKLALVGKGITFDSGGINVKPGDHMQDMKMDMAGAACVLGVFSVIAKIKPDFSVIGLIAATPNLVSASSILPGDVVKALNGKTIEVLNTDAEGRVTMADSLSFAVKEGATHILDFATLTGACMVALGMEIAGIFSNDRDLIEEVKLAAFAEGEKVWELPLEKDYKAQNRSEVADIANIPNNRYGGTITAALFLQEFIGNKPWVHFDIAGPAFASKSYELGPQGGTGFGVRTVLQLLERNN